MTTKRRKGTTPRGWKLRLLGEPALVSPAGREHLLERRAAALLALAVLDRGITRRNAARMLWPDSSEANARQALRQQLLRLKKVWGGLLEAGDSLQLGPGVLTDLDAAEGTGILLGSFEYCDEEELGRWVAHERERRRGTVVENLSASLAQAEQARDLKASTEIAQRLIAADERNESHYRTLMRLHYLAGDVAQAQAAYERLREMLERDFAARPSAETEQLARTIRSATAGRLVAPRGPPPSLLRPPRLIGRDAAWRALHECWRERRVAMLRAVAGMGKTRLATDFAAKHGPVMIIAARPGDALAADSLLARVARALLERGALVDARTRAFLTYLLPELGDPPGGRQGAERAQLVRALEPLFDAAVREGVAGLVLEDLHYADTASLEALQSLAVHGGMRFAFTFRGEELPAKGNELVESLVASGAGRVIDLDALREDEVCELIDSLELPGVASVSLAPRIARHTGGNPLFVLETVKALVLEGAPQDASMPLPVAANARELIARRLLKLSPRALVLARCASVAGQDFSAELASHVLDMRSIDLTDIWAELEQVHVFRDGAFDHDLVREAALATVPGAIARRLHAEIAAFLEGAGTEPARVAHHWSAAQRPREAATAFERAATRAREAGRRTEEAMLLAQAADCHASVGARDRRFDALLARAEAMMRIDLGEETREAVIAARAAAGNDEQRVHALLCEAEFVSHRSESDETVDTGRRGLALARSLGRAELEVCFAAIAASGLCELRRVDEALACLQPYRERVGGLEPRVAIDYLIQLGIALDLANRLGAALDAFEAARRTALEHGHKDLLATALSNLATTTSKRGGLSRAVEYGRQALQLWREAEPLKGTPMQTQTLLAHRLRDLGHYREAIELLEEALAEFRRAGVRAWTFASAHRLALAYAHVGQHARALKLLHDDPEGLPLKSRAIWEAHRGEVARLAGREGLPPMRAALAILGEEVDDGNNRLVGLLASAVLPPAEGESTAAAVAAWAASRERFGMAMAAHARAASCALALGAVDRSVAQVEAALRLAADYEPDNFYRAELWWIGSRALLAAGRTQEAQRLLAQAREWIFKVADEHVRAEFRDSFLNRNPVNRALLNAARHGTPAG